jgi:hypothetical protein
VLPLLQQAIRTSDDARRLAAIGGLAAHAGDDAIEALRWVAGADAGPRVSGAAIDALAAIAARDRPGATVAVDALIDLLQDTARRDAVEAALASLPDACIDEVARGLQRRDADVRRHVVASLSRFKSADATRWLSEALSDESAAVRETAVLGLMRLGARGVDARLQEIARTDPSRSVRQAASAAVASRRSTP